MPALVVFDTNILFSATAWRGSPFQCVELARSGQVQAVSCADIMNELSEKPAAKLAFTPEQVDDTLADYLTFLPLVNIPHTLDVVARDPEDNAVLECALVGGAQFVVTGDLDLLTIKKFRDIEVIRAAEFMQRWQAGEIEK